MRLAILETMPSAIIVETISEAYVPASCQIHSP
jgi:hypothetical protein